VDLVGGEVAGGLDGHAVRVPLLPLRHAGPGDRLARLRVVLVVPELLQLAQRRQDVRPQCVEHRLAQALLFGHGGLHEGELVDRALGRIVDDLVGDRLPDGADDDPRRRDPCFRAAAQQGNRVVDRLWIGAQAGDEVLVVLDGVARHLLRELAQGHVDAAHLVDGRQLEREARAFDRLPRLVEEKVVVELVGVAEFGPVDRLEAGQRLFDVLAPLLPRGGGAVGEPVVIAAVAVVGGQLRVVAELPLPLFVEQTAEGFGVVRNGRDRKQH
jgi:hypothetical protein